MLGFGEGQLKLSTIVNPGCTCQLQNEDGCGVATMNLDGQPLQNKPGNTCPPSFCRPSW